MKILVTGATGFIGKKLIAELFTQGHSLNILTRDIKKAKQTLCFPLSFYEWNPQSRNSSVPEAALEGVEGVINLMGENIGEKRWSPERKQELVNSRVETGKLIVKAIEKHEEKAKRKISVILSASAIGFYPKNSPEKYDEQGPIGHDFLAELCQAWERAINKAPIAQRKITMRIGIILGSGGGALSKMLLPFKAGVGGAIGSGEQMMSWIHLTDLVRIMSLAVQDPSFSGVYNAVAPHPVTNKVFSQQLARALGRPSFLPVPTGVLQLMLGEMSSLAIDGQYISPKRLLTEFTSQGQFQFQFPTISQALENIFPKYSSGEVNVNHCDLFEEKTWVPGKIEEIFHFFTNSKNLETLTPAWLNLSLVGQTTRTVEKGTLIDYKLQLKGIPFFWRSLIKDFDPKRSYFSDIQLKGPYKFWVHQHFFEECRGGVLITDHIYYKIPGGPLGSLFTDSMVKKDLSKIFSFRKNKLREIFSINSEI